MSAPQDDLWRQFWIFQANPKQYNVLSQLKIGQQVNWYVSRFIERYRVGDIVYLWIAGEKAGIYGWAEVQSEVYQDEDGKQRLSTVYQGVLAKPLERPFLRSQINSFDGLSILRNPTGANFRVTVLEAIELNRLIRENGDNPPANPDEVPDPNNSQQSFAKAIYLLDYRFDSMVKSIILTCLQSSHKINQVIFPTLLLQSTLLYFHSKADDEKTFKLAFLLNQKIPLGDIFRRLKFVNEANQEADSTFSLEKFYGILVKRNSLRILSSARRFAIKTTGREQITARHLLGAILQGVTESLQNYLQQEILTPNGISLADFRENFIEIVAELYPQDRVDAWRALLNEELTADNESQNFGPLLTKLDSDSADESQLDYLDIDDDTIAISKVLCARDAAPPIAIGLFGEWGSGKTFFMRRIHDHVNSLTSRVEALADETNSAYHTKVAQIWFNAWNYQDGNLWASLVNHVFAGLKQELKRLNQNSADQEFESLMERLDEDRVLEKHLAESSSRIKKLKDEKNDIVKEISILQKTNKKIQKKAPSEQIQLPSFAQLKQYSGEIETILEVSGGSSLLNSMSENNQQLQSMIKQWSMLSVEFKLSKWMRFFTQTKKRALIFMLSLVVVLSASIFLIFNLKLLGGFLSALLIGLSVCSVHFSKLGRLFSLLRKLNRELTSASLQSERNIQRELQQNSKKLQQLELDKLENEAKISEWQKEYDKLNADYGEPSSETFANFIFARAQSKDYKSQLGLLNTVRRDFSRLNQLLINQTDDKLPKLDRIILYIDDLDRCEPDIVVDVLQAIHLMLAFPLFMVVVGVDARWLGRSLKKRYSFLVHEKDDKEFNGTDYHAASTHDYLEKIFQIPFWLKRLDGQRANDMMKALLAAKADSTVVTSNTQSSDKVGDGVNDELGGGTIEELASHGEFFEETEDQAENYQDLVAQDELLINNLVSTRSLEMSEPERLFLESLGAVVGRSPRAIKRFINLYRILKASHKKARMADFSKANGEFQAPLFLLAVICGSPKEADTFFRYLLLSQPPQTIKIALKDAGSYVDSSGWKSLLAGMHHSKDIIGALQVEMVVRWIPDVARFSYREWVE